MADKFYEPEGSPNAGKISDPNNAQEIAQLEQPARAREAELKRQTEIGLTPDQEKNIAIMNHVKDKYPDAYKSLIDSNGREVVEVTYTRAKNPLVKGNLYFTQEGVLRVSEGQNQSHDGMIPDGVFSRIQFSKTKDTTLYVNKPDISILYTSRKGLKINGSSTLVDIVGDQNDRVLVSMILKESQEAAVLNKQQIAASDAAKSIQSVLAEL